MAVYVTMPKLGLTMTEGLVVKWLKKEGEKVEKSEALLEVATDKITNEVEAPAGGVLKKILIAEGETAGVSAELAIIGEAGEDLSNLRSTLGIKQQEKTGERNIQAERYMITVNRGGFIKASPAAKKYARDKGINLSEIKGSGPQGRIVEKDVIGYAAGLSKLKVSPAAQLLARDLQLDLSVIKKESRIMKEDVLTAVRTITSEEESRIPPTSMRRVIAERMSASWHTSPMVTLHMETDVTELKIFRGKMQKSLKVSYNDLLIKICAKVLTEYPMVNAGFDGEHYILHSEVNIGLAISLEGGLIVPNVKKAQAKTIREIAAETGELIDKAKNNKLSGAELTGGTFTISNLGMFGINAFTPIINQPEAAILGVNAILDRPVVVDGQVEVRPLMNLSLTFDHRIIDGADGARFLARIKELVENPALLLL
ncbi:MAG: dihydrolipoamide acetyltransferase family protein [Peptococcaceae bacterium]